MRVTDLTRALLADALEAQSLVAARHRWRHPDSRDFILPELARRQWQAEWNARLTFWLGIDAEDVE